MFKRDKLFGKEQTLSAGYKHYCGPDIQHCCCLSTYWLSSSHCWWTIRFTIVAITNKVIPSDNLTLAFRLIEGCAAAKDTVAVVNSGVNDADEST